MSGRRRLLPHISEEEEARELAAYEREHERALAHAIRGRDPDKWHKALSRHTQEYVESLGEPPEPHECQHCAKVVIDVGGKAYEDPFSNGRLVGPKSLGFSVTLEEVQIGAEDGCELFKLVLSQYELPVEQEDLEGTYHLKAWGQMRGSQHGHDLDILTEFGLIDHHRPWTKWMNKNTRDSGAPGAYLQVWTESDNDATEFISNRPISLNPWSKATIEKARSSLHECLDTDKGSSNFHSRDVGLMPSRLLKLTEVQGKLALQLTQIDSNVDFCTLSYCWGVDQLGTTTIANIQDRYRALNCEELPRTIRDAVMVAHSLSFEYIWVDAICIIQDDPEDQALEISKMADIYAQSDLCICISRSLSADEGFLHSRTPHYEGSPYFRLPFMNPLTRKVTGHITCTNLSAASHDNRLQERAWGFQERINSKRVLDFGGCTTSFSCCHSETDSHDWQDGGPADTADQWHQTDTWRYKLNHVENLQLAGQMDHDMLRNSGFTGQWFNIVRAFTEKDLTFPEDRVLAIAAVAQRFHQLMPDEYVAGLWEMSMPWSLMWNMRDRPKRLPRPEKYQGPSWSWIGINGMAHFFYAMYLARGQATITIGNPGREIELADSAAPFGAVVSGALVLKGMIRKARWLRRQESEGIDRDSIAFHPDDTPEWTNDPILKVDDVPPDTYAPHQLMPAYMYPDALEPEFAKSISEGGKAYLDVVILHAFASRQQNECMGLVLRPLDDEGLFYSRLGIFGSHPGVNERYLENTRAHSTSGEPAGEDSGEQAAKDGEPKDPWVQETSQLVKACFENLAQNAEKEQKKIRQSFMNTHWLEWLGNQAPDRHRICVLV